MANPLFMVIWDTKTYDTPQCGADAAWQAEQLIEKARQTEEVEQEENTFKSILVTPPHVLAFAKELEEKIEQHPNKEEQSYLRYLYEAIPVHSMNTSPRTFFVLDVSEIDSVFIILNFLVKLTNKYNLVVYDQKTTITFVPPNIVLDEPEKIKWLAIEAYFSQKDFPKTPNKFQIWFDKIISSILKPLGFLKDDEATYGVSYKRVYNWLSQHIYFCADLIDGEINFFITFEVKSFIINNIFEKIIGEKNNKYVYSVNILDDVKKGLFDTYIIRNKFEAIKILESIQKNMLPILDATTDIINLDRAMNSNDFPKLKEATKSWQSLIVARLVNNSNFEKLVEELEKKDVRNTIDNINWNQFVNGLRTLNIEERNYIDVISKYLRNISREELLLQGEWYDITTNLIWQRYCLGQVWENGKATGLAKQMSWQNAIDSIKPNIDNLVIDFGWHYSKYGLLDDYVWRLPTEKELASLMLIDKAGYKTEQGVLFCPKEEGQYATFWTSTTQKNSEEASVVVFYEGKVRKYPKGYGCFVRLVRNGKNRIINE